MRRPGGSAQIPTGPATPQEMATPAILNRLDLKTLRLFAAICEDGTLNGAARRAAIAPSAVSKRLAELERALGCQLLARGPKGMRPTPAGETLLHHTRRMLASAEQISLELAEHARGVRGFVRVLANLSAIVQFLPDDLQAFLAAQGEIRVDLEERPSTGVVTGVEDGAADLGICAGGTDTTPIPIAATASSSSCRPDIPWPGGTRCPWPRPSITTMSGCTGKARSTRPCATRPGASGAP